MLSLKPTIKKSAAPASVRIKAAEYVRGTRDEPGFTQLEEEKTAVALGADIASIRAAARCYGTTPDRLLSIGIVGDLEKSASIGVGKRAERNVESALMKLANAGRGLTDDAFNTVCQFFNFSPFVFDKYAAFTGVDRDHLLGEALFQDGQVKEATNALELACGPFLPVVYHLGDMEDIVKVASGENIDIGFIIQRLLGDEKLASEIDIESLYKLAEEKLAIFGLLGRMGRGLFRGGAKATHAVGSRLGGKGGRQMMGVAEDLMGAAAKRQKALAGAAGSALADPMAKGMGSASRGRMARETLERASNAGNYEKALSGMQEARMSRPLRSGQLKGMTTAPGPGQVQVPENVLGGSGPAGKITGVDLRPTPKGTVDLAQTPGATPKTVTPAGRTTPQARQQVANQEAAQAAKQQPVVQQQQPVVQQQAQQAAVNQGAGAVQPQQQATAQVPTGGVGQFWGTLSPTEKAILMGTAIPATGYVAGQLAS